MPCTCQSLGRSNASTNTGVSQIRQDPKGIDVSRTHRGLQLGNVCGIGACRFPKEIEGSGAFNAPESDRTLAGTCSNLKGSEGAVASRCNGVKRAGQMCRQVHRDVMGARRADSAES